VSGFSSGGAFTTYLSCQLDAWGAVAPMAGVNLSAPCPTRPPVPMITFHGDMDMFANYTGLPGADNTTNPDAFYDADVQKTVDQFAVRNGCQPGRVDTTPVAGITKRTYNGCTAETVLYIVAGAGHTYTGGPKLPAALTAGIGEQSQATDAAKALLDFFDAHPRTTPPVLVPATAAATAPSGAPAGGGSAPVVATITAVAAP
jgi:polyhydroxybutyrate depolymerase